MIRPVTGPNFFGGGGPGLEIVATAVSKKGATIAGAEVPEKLIYFWPSKLAKNVSIF